MKLLKNLTIIVDKISTVFAALAGSLLILMSLAITINSLTRYLFNLSSAIILEITEYCLLWMTFLGVAWLAKKDGHIRIDLIMNVTGPTARKYFGAVTLYIETLLFFIITLYSAYVTYIDFKANLLLQTVLQPPKWTVEIIIPLGSFFLFLHLLVKVFENIMDAPGKRSMPLNPAEE